MGNAIPSDVLENKTFSGDAGVGISGEMPDNGAVSITPSASGKYIPVGYHTGLGIVEGDPDLVPANIKSDTTIFGVLGTFDGSGTANMFWGCREGSWDAFVCYDDCNITTNHTMDLECQNVCLQRWDPENEIMEKIYVINALH